MAESIYYAKTAKGAEEITQRRNNLRGKMRTMLILVDRGKTADELRAQAAALGVPPDFLETLVNDGYIAPVVSAAPTAAPAAAGSSAAGASAAGASSPAARAPADAQPTGEEATKFWKAKTFMNETAVNALGVRAFLFTLKLERCSTRAELLALADEYEKVIRKGSGVSEAQVLVNRLKEMLA